MYKTDINRNNRTLYAAGKIQEGVSRFLTVAKKHDTGFWKKGYDLPVFVTYLTISSKISLLVKGLLTHSLQTTRNITIVRDMYNSRARKCQEQLEGVSAKEFYLLRYTMALETLLLSPLE